MESAPYRWAKASAPDGRDFLGLRSGADARALARAVRELDDSERRRTEPAQRGRASVILAAFDDARGQLTMAHMGDARAYLYRKPPMTRELPVPLAPRFCPEVVTEDGGGMVCLTWDHNTACDLVELELLSRRDGRRRARRRVLTRGLGAEPPTDPDLVVASLMPGDRLLLCTAGVWLAVDDDAIADILAGEPEPQAACRALVDAAREGRAPHPPAALIVDWSGGPVAIDQEPRSTGVVVEPTTVIPDSAGPVPLAGTLGKLGRDLSVARGGQPPVIGGRKGELRALIRCLMRMQKPNVVLVGEPGVGKTWLVEALARVLATPACPPKLAGCRVVEIAMSSLVAGTRYRGDFEERMDNLIREAEADPSIILFIDEIHLVTGAGSGADGGLDAGNLLKPALARGRLRVIGATTAAELDRSLARDEALMRRFEILRIEEPGRADALQILDVVARELEKHHGLTIGSEACEAAVDLAVRYLPDRRLPDKAIDLLDQACTRAVSRWLSMSLAPSMVLRQSSGQAGAEVQGDGQTVTRADVATVIAERCAMPVELVSLDDRERLASLPALLGQRVIGQDAAVAAAARVLQRGYRGLAAPEKPVASLLLCGPTGVGKTSLALAIAELLFDSERALLRIDMSEYMERHAVSRLLGAAPGYVGHDEEGQLIAAMRERPARVVLFDEIEKAHPEVLNILLQILDAGTVRGSRGQKVSFRDAVVVLTSNLLAELPNKARAIGFGSGAGGDDTTDEAAVREHLARALSPELVGRIGAVIRFDLLGPDALVAIAERHLAVLVERLLAAGTLRAVPAELRTRVLSRIASARDSARGVERMVEDEVETWLAADEAGRATQPGAILVDRLGGRQRAAVAVMVEVAADPTAALDRLRQAADLVYLSHAGLGALAAFGGVEPALAAAAASTADRVVIHWGRVGREGGALRGAAIDRALSLARAREDGLDGVLLTGDAREHVGEDRAGELADLGEVAVGLTATRVWSWRRR